MKYLVTALFSLVSIIIQGANITLTGSEIYAVSGTTVSVAYPPFDKSLGKLLTANLYIHVLINQHVFGSAEASGTATVSSRTDFEMTWQTSYSQGRSENWSFPVSIGPVDASVSSIGTGYFQDGIVGRSPTTTKDLKLCAAGSVSVAVSSELTSSIVGPFGSPPEWSVYVEMIPVIVYGYSSR